MGAQLCSVTPLPWTSWDFWRTDIGQGSSHPIICLHRNSQHSNPWHHLTAACSIWVDIFLSFISIWELILVLLLLFFFGSSWSMSEVGEGDFDAFSFPPTRVRCVCFVQFLFVFRAIILIYLPIIRGGNDILPLSRLIMLCSMHFRWLKTISFLIYFEHFFFISSK